MNYYWIISLDSNFTQDDFTKLFKSVNIEGGRSLCDICRFEQWHNGWFAGTDSAGNATSVNENKIQDVLKRFTNEKVNSLTTDWVELGNDIALHGHTLNFSIIFIGNLDQSDTWSYFHLLSTAIRQSQRQSMTFNCNLKIYGLLAYSQTINTSFSENQLLFFHQLNAMQHNRTRSLVPFDRIYLTQKDIDSLQHKNRLNQVLLFLTSTGRLPGNTIYQQIGVSGVYFDNDVQQKNEALLLTRLLVNAFASNDRDRDFYDLVQAESYVRNSSMVNDKKIECQRFITDLTHDFDGLTITDDKNRLNKSNHPVLNILSPSIITNYYYGYIPKVIHRLVNHWAPYYQNKVNQFKEHLRQKGYKIQASNKVLIEEVSFDLFKFSSRNISSIKQQGKVLEKIKSHIKQEKVNTENFDDYNNVFPVPADLKNVYDNSNDSEDVLVKLKNKLETHPVLSAKLIRAFLVSISFVLVAGPFLSWIADSGFIDIGPIKIVRPILYFISALFPITVAAIQIRRLLKRIRTYQREYKAALLKEANDEAKKALQEKLIELYQNLDKLIEIQIKKNEKAFTNLDIVEFAKSKFHSNPLFQPLWHAEFESGQQGVFASRGESGKFNQVPILRDYPLFKVKLDHVGALQPDFVQFVNDAPNQMYLIKKWLQESIRGERSADNVFSNSCSVSALLVLDVSGSMYGDRIENLRKAVKQIPYDNIKWIAFSGDVYKDSNGKTLFDKTDAIPNPNGGTELLKAFSHIKEENLAHAYDKIILISDGEPFSPESCLAEAPTLGVPVDTIFIGGSSQFMQDLAALTGGTYLVPDNLAEDLANSLIKLFTVQISDPTRPMQVWEALKYGYYPECVDAAYNFAQRYVDAQNHNTVSLLRDFYNDNGVIEFERARKPIGPLRAGLPTPSSNRLFTTFGGSSGLTMLKGLEIGNINDKIIQSIEVIEFNEIKYLPFAQIINGKDEKTIVGSKANDEVMVIFNSIVENNSKFIF